MAGRVASTGYCSLCRVSARNVAVHMATASHRKRERSGSDMSRVSMKDRPAWLHGRKPEDYITEDMELEALERLAAPAPEPEWLGIAILAGIMVPAEPEPGTRVVDLPPTEPEPAPIAAAPQRGVERAVRMPHPPRAIRGYRPAPCHRCGRADFATDNGRAWHLENNPGCAKSRRPDKYQYITIGG